MIGEDWNGMPCFGMLIFLDVFISLQILITVGSIDSLTFSGFTIALIVELTKSRILL